MKNQKNKTEGKTSQLKKDYDFYRKISLIPVYKCIDCDCITESKMGMQDHWRREHKLKEGGN